MRLNRLSHTAGKNVERRSVWVVVQFEKSSKDCHSEARLSREESAGLLLAASRFLADKAGFGMTRRAFLRKLHHDPNLGQLAILLTTKDTKYHQENLEV